jgi:hypothetical protein
MFGKDRAGQTARNPTSAPECWVTRGHFRINGAFGADSLGAAGEIANVSHAFQPSARWVLASILLWVKAYMMYL